MYGGLFLSRSDTTNHKYVLKQYETCLGYTPEAGQTSVHGAPN